MKRFRLLALLAVMTLVLSACATQQATPTAAPTPTPKPEATPMGQVAQPPTPVSTPTPVPTPTMPVVTGEFVLAFAPNRIAVIDPKEARVVKDIPTNQTEAEYVEAGFDSKERLLFVVDRANAQILVIDTEKLEAVKTIDVGQRPVHIYNPFKKDEIWVHADGEGVFYIIDSKTLEVTAKIAKPFSNPGHGKLVYNKELGTKGYVTDVNNTTVTVVDMEKKSVIKTFEVCEGKPGTHYAVYSTVTKRIYFECSGIGKTAIVDPTTDTVLGYLEDRGATRLLDQEKLLLIVRKRDNMLSVYDLSQQQETLKGTIPIEGGPDKIYVVKQDGKLLGFVTTTLTPDVVVVDLDAMKVVKRVAAGDIERPEGARNLHRSGELGHDFFYTPASGDGVVAIIDVKRQTLHAAVPVAKGVRTVVAKHDH
jgi:DNA-binding beta-propeller fold protein YncE